MYYRGGKLIAKKINYLPSERNLFSFLLKFAEKWNQNRIMGTGKKRLELVKNRCAQTKSLSPKNHHILKHLLHFSRVTQNRHNIQPVYFIAYIPILRNPWRYIFSSRRLVRAIHLSTRCTIYNTTSNSKLGVSLAFNLSMRY